MFQHIYDFLLAPLRMGLLPDQAAERLGLNSLENERIFSVLPHIKGRLLDIGCGNNRLCNIYGNGVGVDVYDWGGGGMLLNNPYVLPFENDSFDTITMLASLNHIPERKKMLREVKRVLKDDGRVVITMINPIIGFIVHNALWHSEDKERGMAEGELDGIWNSELKQLFQQAGYHQVSRENFLYQLNNIHIYQKA